MGREPDTFAALVRASQGAHPPPFALATLAAPALLKAQNEGDKINLAFIGPGGMGTTSRRCTQRDDVIFSFVCDADSKRAEAGAKLNQEAPADRRRRSSRTCAGCLRDKACRQC